MKPWGRFATLGLAGLAFIGPQIIGLAAVVWWYGLPPSRLPDLTGDGVAITILIAVSTPVEIALLVLFAQRTGMSARDYLAWTMPRRADIVVGVAAAAGFIVLADLVNWAAGRSIVTAFQDQIYTTAAAQGWLALLWIAVVLLTPIAEESLFRGFLFRGWFRAPMDAWPAIVLTALLFAVLHVQYDWFVMAQVFGFGLLLAWLRWVSGSTLLTMLLHALINLEAMIETMLSHQ